MTTQPSDSTDAPRPRRWPIIAAVGFTLGVLAATVLAGGDRASSAPVVDRPTIPVKSPNPAELFTPVDPRLGSAEVPGPTRVEAGAPAGFARSPEGALAAAASYLPDSQILYGKNPTQAEATIRQMTASVTADERVVGVLADLEELRAVVDEGQGPLVMHQGAVSWRIDSYSPSAARVSVWGVAVVALQGVAPPQAAWSITTFDLVWEGDDWKTLDRIVEFGPVPMADDSAPPATTSELTSALDGFRDFAISAG